MGIIEVEHVYKVFGHQPKEAVKKLKEGISAEELEKEHGAVAAVIDATFEVHAGEIFVVMGLSGSGKSTLVRTINRLFEPTEGTIRIEDTDVTKLDPKALRDLRARKVSMVFQHFALFPHRTVLENAAWGLEVGKKDEKERREAASEALELVGLGGRGDSYPQQLSGGMQQRVGLARALATDADILLMDEAFSALDPLIRREMQDQLIDLQESLQKTIVFITHDLLEAMRLGDRIAMLKSGRIVQIGTSEDILQDPANDYVAAFVQDVDRSRVLTASAVMEDPITTVQLHEGPSAAARIMRENQLSAVFVVGPQRKRYLGAITAEDAIDASKRGVKRVDEVSQADLVQTVTPDTLLVDILTPASETTLPIPVVENGHLLGVVPRVTLLAALGTSPDLEPGEEAEEEQTEEEPGSPSSGQEADGDEAGAPATADSSSEHEVGTTDA